MLKTCTILSLVSFGCPKFGILSITEILFFLYFQQRFVNLCLYIYMILTGSRIYNHFESTFIIWNPQNYNLVSVVWMHKY